MSSINYSRIKTYMDCPYKYDLVYNRRIMKTRTPRPMSLGSAIHKGMEWAFRGQDPDEGVDIWEKEYISRLQDQEDLVIVEDNETFNLSELLVQESEDIGEQAKAIVRRTLRYFNPEDWEVVEIDGVPAIELNIDYMVDNVTYHGHIDLVAKEKATGMIWLIDYKSRQQFTDIDQEYSNLQMAMYQRMLMALGVEVVGSMVLQISSKPNTIPKVNKDGTISRARIFTTWDDYSLFVKENGQDPEDYLDMMDKLDMKMVEPLFYFRSPRLVESIFDDTVRTLTRKMQEDTHYQRNLNFFNCMGCQYRDICETELDGDPIDHYLTAGLFYIADTPEDRPEDRINNREEDIDGNVQG